MNLCLLNHAEKMRWMALVMRAVNAPSVALTQTNSNSKNKTFHNANTLQAQRGLLRLLRKGKVLQAPCTHVFIEHPHLYLHLQGCSEFSPPHCGISITLRTLFYNIKDNYASMLEINKALILLSGIKWTKNGK